MIEKINFVRTINDKTFEPVVKVSFDMNLELMQDTSVKLSKGDFAKALGQDILDLYDKHVRSTDNYVKK